MSLFDHFINLTLTSDQQQALEKIDVFLKGDERVFILKGYAGSGKTTMIKGLVGFLKSEKREYQVMAPTGRAAKVLRDKTGYGETIHKGIYNFSKLETYRDETEDVAEKSFEYFFPIKFLNNTHRVIIVDEASMVSDVFTQHELFRFGSGKLLTDLISFMQFNQPGNKIIFVGDPAQLPPFSDPNSKALNEDYFASMGILCSGFEMKEVARQAADSLILKNATNIRQLLEKTQRNEISIEIDDKECVRLLSHQVHERYVQDFPLPEVGNGVIISYSNAQCLTYNQMIREKLFPENPQITEGDIVMINNNNYHTYGVELYNGDMAKVVSVSPEIKLQSAPVMVGEGALQKRKTIQLAFRDIVIRLPHYDQDIPCKIIESLLNNHERDLTIYEMKALYVNFVMRFEDEQKLRLARGLNRYKIGSDEFKEELKSDPFFNALRVKFGYAITCHKAQGGEWEKAYVDFFARTGLKDDHLRWCYTAITRASKTLFAINPPNITSLTRLKFSQVGKIGKLPSNAIQYNHVPVTPFHGVQSHPAKRLKYFEITEKLANTPFHLEKVVSNDYQETYYFNNEDGEIRIDAWHDEAGIFKATKAVNSSTAISALVEIIRLPFEHQFCVEYLPSADFLTTLWRKMQTCCDDLGVQITNVDEQPDRFYVNYFFKTSGIGSYIQFFFNKNGQFSTAMPKSDLGAEDELLNQLIQKLS